MEETARPDSEFLSKSHRTNVVFWSKEWYHKSKLELEKYLVGECGPVI